MKKLTILTVIAMALINCKNPSDNIPELPPTVRLPGQFSATVLSDTMGTNNARNVSLGTFTITNSKSIYFILRNVGDFPIHDITLTPGKLDGVTFEPFTDNGVTASPSGITVLETSGRTSVETVIEVNINHGEVIGLISQQYVHKADFAGATIRIQGKTTDEDDNDIDISLDAGIETLIKVASFEVHYSADEGATYTKAEWGHPNDPTFKQFLIPPEYRNYIIILNTGNVPLKYSVATDDGEFLEWPDLNAGEAKSLPAYGDNIGNLHSKYFYVDTLGIVFDNCGNEDLRFRPGTSLIGNAFRNINVSSIQYGVDQN